jgi:hypothetical protein
LARSISSSRVTGVKSRSWAMAMIASSSKPAVE